MKRILLFIMCIFLTSAAFAKADASEPNVIIYTMSWGPKYPAGSAQFMVDYFKANNIGVEVRDVNTEGVNNRKNIPNRKEMVKKSRQGGYPVFDLNGKIVIGWGPSPYKQIMDFVKNYSYKVEPVGLKKIFEKAQQYDANNIEANLILEKFFLLNKTNLICEFCSTPRLTIMVEKGSFGSVPEQKIAVITVAKNTAINDYRRALGEFRRVCSDSGSSAVKEAKTAWDQAVKEDGFISYQWVKLFTATTKGNILLKASYLPQSQTKNTAEFVAIKDEAERILDELFNEESLTRTN